jgi:lipopolysaccharide/colanic/teichoic acid biosynthesis glycosyltransferase
VDDSSVDVAGEKNKRRRRLSGRAADKTGTTTEQVSSGRLPLGAPIVRAPISSRPSAPVNLGEGINPEGGPPEAAQLAQIEGLPGGRRSRAHPGPPEALKPPKVMRPLTVVDGESIEFETDAEENSLRTLSPPTATALGDFAAAMSGPIAAALYVQSLAVFIATALLVLLVRAQGRRSALSEVEISSLSPIVAGIGAFVLSLAVDSAPGIGHAATAGLLALGVGAVAALTVKLIADRFVHVRIAVLGEASSAHYLAWQIANENVKRCSIVGYVTRTSERDNLRDLDHISFQVRRLGVLADLSHIVARNDIDLLVMATNDDRLKVFERATVCTERYGTRLLSLTAFEEAVFRRVPVEQLNVAWFQHVMHPRFRPAPRLITRSVDLVFATVAGILTVPFWAPAAAFMRIAFGKPVLVRRRRVGERGASFSMYLFRVARRDVTGGPPSEDARAVGFGKFLRATRIEKLPMLINVLRGDLSVVGPRPAAPKRASEAETSLPFYNRRNLVRPGLTGWAQLREPKMRDDSGERDAENELAHDLFYLKHQSLMLYVFVLLATVWRGFTGPPRATPN